MIIESQLEGLAEHADKALDSVNRSTRNLFSLIAENAKCFDFSFTDKHQEIVDQIVENGAVADSASFIIDKILESDRSGSVDLELKGVSRDVNSLNGRIREFLNDTNPRDRGFAYVAWRMRPEQYYYVGKAGGNARLNLAQNGDLLDALKLENATFLSLVFPPMSTPLNVANLEAAILHLIRYKTGRLPLNNTRKESLTAKLDCRAEMAQIRRLISQIARKLG